MLNLVKADFIVLDALSGISGSADRYAVTFRSVLTINYYQYLTKLGTDNRTANERLSKLGS